MENKVENKPIIQLDIEKWIPNNNELCMMDLKQFLYKELILKESDFRQAIDEKDWSEYKDKYTLIYVSNKAIIPQWAYLIIANKLREVNSPCFLKTENYREDILMYILEHRDYSEYEKKRVLIKGCSQEKLSQMPYIRISQLLTPIVKALSFGESCSTVPIFKN